MTASRIGHQRHLDGKVPHAAGASGDIGAAAHVWLCSHTAAFVNGTTPIIDGGKLAGTRPVAMQRKHAR